MQWHSQVQLVARDNLIADCFNRVFDCFQSIFLYLSHSKWLTFWKTKHKSQIGTFQSRLQLVLSYAIADIRKLHYGIGKGVHFQSNKQQVFIYPAVMFAVMEYVLLDLLDTLSTTELLQCLFQDYILGEMRKLRGRNLKYNLSHVSTFQKNFGGNFTP